MLYLAEPLFRRSGIRILQTSEVGKPLTDMESEIAQILIGLLQCLEYVETDLTGVVVVTVCMKNVTNCQEERVWGISP